MIFTGSRNCTLNRFWLVHVVVVMPSCVVHGSRSAPFTSLLQASFKPRNVFRRRPRRGWALLYESSPRKPWLRFTVVVKLVSNANVHSGSVVVFHDFEIFLLVFSIATPGRPLPSVFKHHGWGVDFGFAHGKDVDSQCCIGVTRATLEMTRPSCALAH